jgi:phage protein D
MQPDFQILADERDITDLIRDRLLSVRTTDKPGLESDECELTIDDRDGAVAFPKKGATLKVSLGYVGDKKLTFIGQYRVDEIEVSGPPQTIVIRAKPLDIAETMKDQRRFSWEGKKLADIVSDIAQRNQLKLMCSVEVGIPRVDQINESDMHFITRLAREHGATASIKDGKLIVAPRGEGQAGSGRPLPEVMLKRDDLASYSMTFPDRPAYGATAANWHNNKTGKVEVIHRPNPNGDTGPTYTERHIYPSLEDAEAAAKSRVEGLNRATMTGKMELMRGRADVGAERWLQIQGVKDEVDGVYLIESVEQNFNKSAWITSLNINAGNGGKSKVGKKGNKGDLQVIHRPDPPT